MKLAGGGVGGVVLDGDASIGRVVMSVLLVFVEMVGDSLRDVGGIYSTM